jgi:hypothetical protein
MTHRCLLMVALLGALGPALGCTDEGDAALGTAAGEAVTSWTNAGDFGASDASATGGELAMLDGATYLVRSDRCDAWSCWSTARALYWRKRTAAGWGRAIAIPGRRTSERVSLAAFDERLYMMHSERDETSGAMSLWLSTFEPRAEAWSEPARLPYATFAGPPAMAAFGDELHIVGIDEDCQMWTASIARDGARSPARLIPAHSSCSRPSLAVLGDRLYAVHRAGATGEIQITHRELGSDISWSTDRPIVDGPGRPPLRSIEPVLAAADGRLHLVFRTPESDQLWWTSFDGGRWATVQPLAWQTTSMPSLAAGASRADVAAANGRIASGEELLLATTADLPDEIGDARAIALKAYRPPPPLEPDAAQSRPSRAYSRLTGRASTQRVSSSEIVPAASSARSSFSRTASLPTSTMKRSAHFLYSVGRGFSAQRSR